MSFPSLSLQNVPRNQEENKTGEELIIDTIKQSNNLQSSHECDSDYSIKLKVRLIYLEFFREI